MNERAILVLEDGRYFTGYRLGALVDAEAEVVFNTGMTGYQEICTDPSYRGQMVVMTYPLIGNYGVNWEEDPESTQPWLAALIVRERCLEYSNWRADQDIHAYLERNAIPGIYGLDTRALTRHLRNQGTMRAVLATFDEHQPIDELVQRAQRVTPLSEKDLVAETATADGYTSSAPAQWSYVYHKNKEADRSDRLVAAMGDGAAAGLRVVVVDCGIKQNILRSLWWYGIEPLVVPFSTSAAGILALQPDGVLVSNGPGDPALLPGPVAMVREILASGLPLFGICLGHQILGQAIGATTSRLKYGHHGCNHPVKDVTSGRVYITSQNHEFQVDRESLPADSGYFISHLNLNDGSVEGLAHREKPVFSVQYHPEGCPGPQDNQYIFDRFVASVVNGKKS